MTEIVDTVHCCRLKNPVFQVLNLPPSPGGMGKGKNLPCNNCLGSQRQTTDLSNWHMRGRYSLSKHSLEDRDIYSLFIVGFWPNMMRNVQNFDHNYDYVSRPHSFKDE